MSFEQDKEPFTDSHLASAEYRKRLERKLSCLIAVLEVACAKVRRSLAGPDPDVERLTRIHRNLRETLEVCQRAKRALERREALPEGLQATLSTVVESDSFGRAQRHIRSRGAHVELSSEEEREKFSELGPIDASEIVGIDLDELARQLQD